jgi:hypothetical protein
MTGQFVGCHAFSRGTGLSETRIAQGFRCYFRCPSLFRGEASKMQTSERPAAYLLHRVTPDTLKMLLIYRARPAPRLFTCCLNADYFLSPARKATSRLWRALMR